MNNMDQQRNLQKLAMAKDNARAEAFEKILNEELFPNKKLSADWKLLSKVAINKSAPMSHKLPLIDFAKAVACDPCEKVTLFQFGVLSNALETVSPDVLGLFGEDYEQFMKEAAGHIDWYQKRVLQIREDIQIKVEKEFQMKTASLNGSGGLKSVTGEA